MGATTSVDSLLVAISTKRIPSVTGPRLTPADTTFTIGFREGKGIWGLWELPTESGGFHIWPLGQEEGEQDRESAEEPAPVEAVAAES